MRLCVDPSLCLIVFITSNCYLPLLQCACCLHQHHNSAYSVFVTVHYHLRVARWQELTWLVTDLFSYLNWCLISVLIEFFSPLFTGCNGCCFSCKCALALYINYTFVWCCYQAPTDLVALTLNYNHWEFATCCWLPHATHTSSSQEVVTCYIHT